MFISEQGLNTTPEVMFTFLKMNMLLVPESFQSENQCCLTLFYGLSDTHSPTGPAPCLFHVFTSSPVQQSHCFWGVAWMFDIACCHSTDETEDPIVPFDAKPFMTLPERIPSKWFEMRHTSLSVFNPDTNPVWWKWKGRGGGRREGVKLEEQRIFCGQATEIIFRVNWPLK